MPSFRNKRAFLAARLENLGLVRLLEWSGRGPGLAVLCYHRLGDPESDPFYQPLISATPEAFEATLRLLGRRYRPIGLDDLVERWDGTRFRLDGPTLLVSFDDGYRDNLDLAVPILQRLGIPAAVFATTGFVLDGRLPWWDHVAWVLRHAEVRRFAIERPEPLTLDLHAGDQASLAAVIAAYLRAPRPDDPALCGHLEERAGMVADPRRLMPRLFLDRSGLRRLAGSGVVTIGAHTASHRRLADLDPAAQLAELEAPRHELESVLGRPVTTVAYPYGDPASADARTRALARDAGYRLGFALRPGRIGAGPPIDPFDLPRFNVMAADPPALLRARLALTARFGGARL